MVEIREILYPTDYSETSRHALEHAVTIARWYDSRVTALHVVHVPLMPSPPILAAFADALPPTVPNYQAHEEELHSWVEPARRAGIRTEVRVDEGNAAHRILEYARGHQTDLIVMGTHGLSGFEHFMVGSVAEKVLRRATCAVLTVPAAAERPAKVPYTRLLCPVDFSESSQAALRYAFSLAEEADASLTILYVFESAPDEGLLLEQVDASEIHRVIDEQARNRLEALVPDEVRVWCKPSTKVAYGKPYQEILAVAATEATDLIVMGIRGRNPLDMTIFGSTTNHIVRRASCPVLTLRH
jgi:nucleotide-binding universal stress UspA family protein